MSGFHHVNTRHSPPRLRKSAATRAARSAPGISQKILLKGSKARKQAKEEEDDEEDPLDFDDGDDMATSFLQYCAMCEKQILVPNSSILYCSEHCRRQDALPSPAGTYPSLSFHAPKRYTEVHPTILDPHGHSLPRYFPTLQPTPRHHNDSRIPPRQHNSKSDLDPTEWKPSESNISDDDDHGPQKIKASHDTKSGKTHTNRPSLQSKEPGEALVYLSKYHTSAESPPGSSTSKRRPATGRTTPSLSHASTASSSCSSKSSLPGTPFSFISPPQNNVPVVSITAAASTASGPASMMEELALGGNETKGLEYGKQKVESTEKSAKGSLKNLLRSNNRR